VTGRWFSPGTLVSSTNKTDHHDITEILLKVALNNITLTPKTYNLSVTVYLNHFVPSFIQVRDIVLY
jgi:hypothetical protein